ncbi:MAG: YARHG domain-containing protein [Acidobacteria bacterium]|nr:YARHG domain-containing protein [Acidobacteriota bacterium]
MSRISSEGLSPAQKRTGARTMLRARLLIASVTLLLILPLMCFARQDAGAMGKWESFDFAKQAVTRTQLKDVSLDDLKLLRGLIFGRHGRVFKDFEIKAYLSERPWYKPNPDFRNSSLNETERANLDLIREAEAKLHDNIEPGDMRWWQSRAFNAKQLGEHTGAEWHILRAEVEAIHGKRFDDEPWLQQYFEDRYWYQPDANYQLKRLSETERRNLTTIDAAQKKQRNVALSPGDMEHFQNAEIREELLRGLGLYELRLLRNEVYARRGRQFRTEWLAQYFGSQPWYEPREDRSEPELSAVEKKNIETIVRYENRLKEDLSAKPVSKALLEGLFLEDARKLRSEIYARHGKVFKDRWLQKYFASFDWYKPNPRYTDAALTQVERRNIASILAYEKKASSLADIVEG